MGGSVVERVAAFVGDRPHKRVAEFLAFDELATLQLVEFLVSGIVSAPNLVGDISCCRHATLGVYGLEKQLTWVFVSELPTRIIPITIRH